MGIRKAQVRKYKRLTPKQKAAIIRTYKHKSRRKRIKSIDDWSPSYEQKMHSLAKARAKKDMNRLGISTDELKAARQRKKYGVLAQAVQASKGVNTRYNTPKNRRTAKRLAYNFFSLFDNKPKRRRKIRRSKRRRKKRRSKR